MDRREERWEFMQQQFAKLQMPVQRFRGIDGKFLDVEALSKQGFVDPKALAQYKLPDEQKLFGCDLTDGAIGCALSHMHIWKDIIEKNGATGADGWWLIIEDDCEFVAEFSEENLQKRLAEVPSDWQLIYLGGQDLMHKQDKLHVAPGVRRNYKGFRETTAYRLF